MSAGMSSARATSAQMRAASTARSSSTRRSAALTVTDTRSGKANTHSAVPPITPSMGAAPEGGAKR